ncbi:MAG: TetR family transcriptional regulator, partial [Pseudonocardiaceae bacterium]|nr:TetR family transcriptional regulator [Pseudonocardiaceae bacterium]
MQVDNRAPSESGHSEHPGLRGQRKQRTRRALLDAALGLLDTHAFASLSLRQVAREAGIVPTAFYRHFTDME